MEDEGLISSELDLSNERKVRAFVSIFEAVITLLKMNFFSISFSIPFPYQYTLIPG